MLISSHCPLLSDFPAEMHDEAFQRFLAYKTRVPVRGAIMLNENMDEVVLVKGWKKNANWSFPRGKINKEEADLDCAVREVYEETGLDLKSAGLVTEGESTKSIEVVMREQHMKLFVFRNVPMDTHFEPRTRKEISKVQWYKLSELPTVKKSKQQQEGKGESLAGHANKFYMVAPFLGPLKKWIAQQRRHDKSRSTTQPISLQQTSAADSAIESEDQGGDAGKEDGAFTRVMDLLRKPLLTNPSDLPEVSGNPPVQPTFERPALGVDSVAAQKSNPPNKHNLLALLGKGTTQLMEPPPQTPAAQVIQEPQMPQSPPHHHLSRMPTLPILPVSSVPIDDHDELRERAIQAPELKPAPPMIEPAGLIPQGLTNLRKQHQIAQNSSRVNPAPYQRTGDPQLLDGSSLFGGENPTVPQANKLPLPKITPQAANLLNLFKKSPADAGRYSASNPSERTSKEENLTPKPLSALFIPSQVSPKSSTNDALQNTSISNQKIDLLNLFHGPLTSALASRSKQEDYLGLPLPPVEMSAVSTPGHSREPSQARKSPQQTKRAPPGQAIVGRKRPSSNRSNLPVSATVNGPLNVPQFEVLAKSPKTDRHLPGDGLEKPEKNAQITILPRPSSSYVSQSIEVLPTRTSDLPMLPPPLGLEPHNLSPHSTSKPLTAAPAAPKKIDQPSAPRISPRPASPKAFQPQILCRPGTARHVRNKSDEPSPIQPLPSPRQISFVPKTSEGSFSTGIGGSDEHKKSLLSLFTTTASGTAPQSQAPLVSPASATPTPAGRDSIAGMISPLGEERIPPLPFASTYGMPRVGPGTSRHILPASSTPPLDPNPPLGNQHQENKKFKLPDPIDTASIATTVASKAMSRKVREPSTTPQYAGTTGAEGAGVDAMIRVGSGEKILSPLGSARQTPTETRDKLLGLLANIKA